MFACTPFNDAGRRSSGQNTPFFDVHVLPGVAFSPWTRMMSTLASGCVQTVVASYLAIVWTSGYCRSKAFSVCDVMHINI